AVRPDQDRIVSRRHEFASPRRVTSARTGAQGPRPTAGGSERRVRPVWDPGGEGVASATVSSPSRTGRFCGNGRSVAFVLIGQIEISPVEQARRPRAGREAGPSAIFPDGLVACDGHSNDLTLAGEVGSHPMQRATVVPHGKRSLAPAEPACETGIVEKAP